MNYIYSDQCRCLSSIVLLIVHTWKYSVDTLSFPINISFSEESEHIHRNTY